jgi:hypothetical protein
MDECELRRSNDIVGVHCDQDECVYWREVEHMDAHDGSREGCAIQHFALLDGGDEVTAWLLCVKRRVERQEDRRDGRPEGRQDLA